MSMLEHKSGLRLVGNVIDTLVKFELDTNARTLGL